MQACCCVPSIVYSLSPRLIGRPTSTHSCPSLLLPLSRPRSPLLYAAAALAAAASMPAARAANTSESTSTVVTAIIMNLVIVGIEFGAFLAIRRFFPVVYAPKTFLGPESKRSPAQDSSLFGWLVNVVKWDKYDILRKQGLDAFMYLEYLELMIICFFPAFFLGYVVLMPVYGTGYSNPAQFSGFEKFTLNHHAPTYHGSLRLIAPLLIQWIFVLWTLYWIRNKMSLFVKLHQEFLVSPQHASLPQARTVLITGIPNEILSEKRLTHMYNHLPGGVAKVWINRTVNKLPDLQAERTKTLDKLEGTTAKTIKKVFKKIKKGKVEGVEMSGTDANGTDVPLGIVDKYLEEKERPHHKLGKFGLFGEKVDTLNWCRDELVRLNTEIEEAQDTFYTDRKTFKPQSSAFILFRQQLAAQIAVSQQAYHLPYRMVGRYADMAPENVVWSNLSMNPYEKKLRTAGFWAATIALCLFWTIPVAFTGIVSNVSGLADKVHWLGWLNHIGVVSGIIQAIGPTVALAVLNMLLPPTLRMFARQSGIPTTTGVELSLMDRYYLFQILQNFLLMTIVSGSASGITQFVTAITENPGQFPTIIAQSIPKASNFFLSYLLLTGLSGFGGGMLQVATLAVYYVKKFLLGTTPRKLWHIENGMGGPAYGTLFPTTSLITIIGIGYSIIAPISAGFVWVTFILYWILYRYNAIYVWDCNPVAETSGRFFPKAVNQIFAALYLEHVLLAALFFLSQYTETDAQGNTTQKQGAIPEGVFIVVLGVIVIAAHIFINDSYKPLYSSLAVSLVKDDPSTVSATGSPGGSTAVEETRPLLTPGTAASPPDQEKYGSEEPKVSGIARTASAPSEDAGAGGVSHANVSAGAVGGASAAHAGGTTHDPEQDLDTFEPPAATQQMRTLWFPNDQYAIGSSEVANARTRELDATNEGTAYQIFKKKLMVSVFAASPPGE